MKKITVLFLLVTTLTFCVAPVEAGEKKIYLSESTSVREETVESPVEETITSEEEVEQETDETEQIKEPELSPEELAALEAQAQLNSINGIEDKKTWFLEYKKIINQYKDILDVPETIYDTYSDDEINLMFRVVETECYDQDFYSKCNVASVIFNRLNSDEFDSTVVEVVTKPNQFAYGRRSISEDTVLAVEYVFEFGDTTGGAVAFHSNARTNSFYGYDYTFTDSIGHHFYK